MRPERARIQIGMRRISARLFRFLVCPRHARDPIHFPGLASVVREGLLEVRRIRGDVRPDVANQDRSALECVLSIKLAAPILEFAHLRRAVYEANLAVSPIQTPLASLRIV